MDTPWITGTVESSYGQDGYIMGDDGTRYYCHQDRCAGVIIDYRPGDPLVFQRVTVDVCLIVAGMKVVFQPVPTANKKHLPVASPWGILVTL